MFERFPCIGISFFNDLVESLQIRKTKVIIGRERLISCDEVEDSFESLWVSSYEGKGFLILSCDEPILSLVKGGFFAVSHGVWNGVVLTSILKKGPMFRGFYVDQVEIDFCWSTTWLVVEGVKSSYCAILFVERIGSHGCVVSRLWVLSTTQAVNLMVLLENLATMLQGRLCYVTIKQSGTEGTKFAVRCFAVKCFAVEFDRRTQGQCLLEETRMKGMSSLLKMAPCLMKEMQFFDVCFWTKMEISTKCRVPRITVTAGHISKEGEVFDNLSLWLSVIDCREALQMFETNIVRLPNRVIFLEMMMTNRCGSFNRSVCAMRRISDVFQGIILNVSGRLHYRGYVNYVVFISDQGNAVMEFIVNCLLGVDLQSVYHVEWYGYYGRMDEFTQNGQCSFANLGGIKLDAYGVNELVNASCRVAARGFEDVEINVDVVVHGTTSGKSANQRSQAGCIWFE